MAAATPSSQALAVTRTHRRRDPHVKDWRDQNQLLVGLTLGTSIACSAGGSKFTKRATEETTAHENLKTVLDRLKGKIHETDSATYARILRACAKFKALTEGKRAHSYIRESGREHDRLLGNHVVEMYLKCGSLRDAQRLFDELISRDAVLWTSMISAYSERGHYRTALKLFQKMQDENVTPDNVTYVTVLNACARLGAIEEGTLVHSQLIDNGFETDVIVGTALLNMYGKCGSLDSARKMFDKIQEKDIVAWNAMLSAYVQHAAYKEAFELYQQMALMPNISTFVTMLNACAGARALEEGKQIYACIVKRGLEADAAIVNALFNMYGKCGNLEDARAIFQKGIKQNVVPWVAMISLYVQRKNSCNGLQVFKQMLLEGLRIDKYTFTTSLGACDGAKCLIDGRLIHKCIVESGFQADVVVRSALIHMYGRCDSLQDAQGLFQEMPQNNVVLLRAMVAAYAKHGHWKEALEIFKRMRILPDKLTIIHILNACNGLSALEEGKALHRRIKEKELDSDVDIRSGLINMYCKCGSLEDARSVFDGMVERDITLWNAMIEAYVGHGQAKMALQLFQQMQVEHVTPNKTTIDSILPVDEGYRSMLKDQLAMENNSYVIELCEQAGVSGEILMTVALGAPVEQSADVADSEGQVKSRRDFSSEN